jgi:DNA-binding SARP family transcriptional activator
MREQPMIDCRTLGPAAVTVDGREPPAELLWRKHLALLVYLARSPRRTRTREHLIGVLWGDRPEPAARHSLREAVHVLRGAAGEEGVATEGEQVRLAEGAVELDVDRLEALAGAGDWAGAAVLVGGEFLEGFGIPGAQAFEDWLGAERGSWRRRSVEVLARRAQELARSGHPAGGAAEARRALALDPLSDVAAAAAVQALALAGERGAALETYEAFVARLAAQVGGAPSDALAALAARVRSEKAWRLPEGLAPERRRGAESRRTPLVGRERELTTLMSLWEACRGTPQAGVAFLGGDAGAGRTRLAEEVLTRARLAGAATAQARAVPADTDEAWSALTGLANGGLLEAPGLAAAAPASLAAFASRLPDWGDRFPEARRAAPASPAQALTDLLRAASGEQPLILLLDDAQWSDRDSLLALGAAVRDLHRAPLLLVITAAPFPAREELDEIKARIPRDVAGASLAVTPLGAEALRALAAWALPSYGAADLDRLTRRVGADSAGLPLLAVELLHAVALGLDLHGTATAKPWPAQNRTLDQSLPGDLPDAVVAAIRIGFRRLSKDAQAVLAAASVLGDRVPARLLAAATNLDAERTAAALDELEWQRWLTAEARGYAFVARIVRDVVARDMLTEGQRLRILEAADAGGAASPPRKRTNR